MKNIGFMGGSSIVETGSISDMIDFFHYLFEITENNTEKELANRLYKKYIKYQDLDVFERYIVGLRSSSKIKSKYARYFDAIITCIESAKMFYASWEIYQPLKVGFTDMPYCIDDKDRHQEQYDALTEDDLPFWQR